MGSILQRRLYGPCGPESIVFDCIFSGFLSYKYASGILQLGHNNYQFASFQLRASQRRVSHKYIDRVAAKKSREERASTETFSFDPTDAVFQTRAETDEEED